MIDFPRLVLPADKIRSVEKKVAEAAEAGRDEDAWQELQPLLKAQSRQGEAAKALLRIVNDGHLSVENSLAVLTDIEACHSEDLEILTLIGDCSEEARDIDFLNAPPPDHPLFGTIVDKLSKALEDPANSRNEARILRGLATTARMMGRQRDEIAEESCRRLVDLNPRTSGRHYDYGLFLKTRRKFDQGMVANQAAVNLSDEPEERYEWNLGICATGAGRGTVALSVWKQMGQKIEMGRFGLPEGSYPMCKVKLAERPLAERSAETDEPGLEETIWIERLSPCHGIIRSVLVQDLGVDYGDVVLIDGAPIAYHMYGDSEIAVFPHLATLVRRDYRFFDFAGTQGQSGELEGVSADLEDDAIVYSHSESYQILCARCWRDPDVDHERHEKTEKHVVTGRIAAPPQLDPRHLLHQLDRAMETRGSCRIYSPELCETAGLHDRAETERRRFDMIKNN